VIITVFCTSNSERENWQSDLLEWSWHRAGQPGELVRLVACGPEDSLPEHALARVVRTHRWNPHPYTGDDYPYYDLPASLLEWLLDERPEATILLVGPRTLFQSTLDEEASPGRAVGNAWSELPVGGTGPFGLAAPYEPLISYCVNRSLPLTGTQLPMLIKASDLKKIAARWIELTGMIRSDIQLPDTRSADASRIACAIASAEYRVGYEVRELAAGSGDAEPAAPLIAYDEPVRSPSGEVVWDPESYRPWEPVEPESAAPGVGRELLAFLQEYVTLRESGGHLRALRPRRRQGVREARVVDRTLLEIPDQPESISLNHSAAEIWNLCDDQRTVTEIVDELERRFEVPRATMAADVELGIKQLRMVGALNLESVRS